MGERGDGMSEELGVLVRVPKLKPLVENEKEFLQIVLFDKGKLVIHRSELKNELVNSHKCTRKEAERFPQFKWVALSELED